ncbi:uncharacterized protein RCO7_09964 [Rhynchosporium graminicola]|uniref:Uncharacterized protein n=2 Tax=Rhynchosporium TaxID=38037 RepID=A0A1E1MS06_RHYSE|nr:uncharacterized protein RCO7_09964 [Rhynchosporium commune]CZT51883.1 uncharacterized protein RSE6_13098 [Rhynchosporium secalis]
MERPFTAFSCIPAFQTPPAIDANGIDIDPAESQTEGINRCDPVPGVEPTLDQSMKLWKMHDAGLDATKTKYGMRKRHQPIVDHTTISKRTACDYSDVVVSNIDEHSAREDEGETVFEAEKEYRKSIVWT